MLMLRVIIAMAVECWAWPTSSAPTTNPTTTPTGSPTPLPPPACTMQLHDGPCWRCNDPTGLTCLVDADYNGDGEIDRTDLESCCAPEVGVGCVLHEGSSEGMCEYVVDRSQCESAEGDNCTPCRGAPGERCLRDGQSDCCADETHLCEDSPEGPVCVAAPTQAPSPAPTPLPDRSSCSQGPGDECSPCLPDTKGGSCLGDSAPNPSFCCAGENNVCIDGRCVSTRDRAPNSPLTTLIE